MLMTRRSSLERRAHHELLALHAVDDPGDRAVPRADLRRQLAQRELADRLEHLHDRELRPGEPVAPGEPFVMRRDSV